MMNFRDKTMLFDIAMKYLYDNNKVEKDLNVLHEVTRLSNVKYDEAINNLCKLSQDVGLFDVDYDFVIERLDDFKKASKVKKWKQ